MIKRPSIVIVSTAGLLAVLFVGLKLVGAIDWPWWLVLSPLWILLAVIVFCCAVVLTIGGLITCLAAFDEFLCKRFLGEDE